MQFGAVAAIDDEAYDSEESDATHTSAYASGDHASETSFSDASAEYTEGDDDDDDGGGGGVGGEDEAADAWARSPPADRQQLAGAFFDTPAFPENVPLDGRRLLRKGSNRTEAEAETVLPRAGRCERLCAVGELGDLVDDVHDKELVGHYVDARGRPVAELWEAKPPPPNADYRVAADPADRRLAMLMGYEQATPRRKAEVGELARPAEHMHGDADLAEQRTARVAELHAREVYFNRQHAQPFAERDSGRDMYDGLNDRRSAAERVRPVDPTKRDQILRPQDPARAHAATGARAVVHARPSRRAELGQPWHRAPHATPHGAVELRSVAALPMLQPTNRGAHAGAAHRAHADLGGGVGARAPDRGEKPASLRTVELAPHADTAGAKVAAHAPLSGADRDQLHAAAPRGAALASGAPLRQMVDALPEHRQLELPRPTVVTSDAWASLVRTLDHERDAGDDAELRDIGMFDMSTAVEQAAAVRPDVALGDSDARVATRRPAAGGGGGGGAAVRPDVALGDSDARVATRRPAGGGGGGGAAAVRPDVALGDADARVATRRPAAGGGGGGGGAAAVRPDVALGDADARVATRRPAAGGGGGGAAAVRPDVELGDADAVRHVRHVAHTPCAPRVHASVALGHADAAPAPRPRAAHLAQHASAALHAAAPLGDADARPTARVGPTAALDAAGVRAFAPLGEGDATRVGRAALGAAPTAGRRVAPAADGLGGERDVASRRVSAASGVEHARRREAFDGLGADRAREATAPPRGAAAGGDAAAVRVGAHESLSRDRDAAVRAAPLASSPVHEPAPRVSHDAPALRRAEYAGRAMLADARVVAREFVPSDADRLPASDVAAYDVGRAASAVERRAVRHEALVRDARRSAVARVPEARPAAPVDRPVRPDVAPPRARAGATLPPDRLAEYPRGAHDMYERRHTPTPSRQRERATPTRVGWADADLVPGAHARFGASDQDGGRETPNSRMFVAPAMPVW